MDIGTATDICIRIQKGGKNLLQPIDGSEVLDYATNELISVFGEDENYSDIDITTAINAFLADEELPTLAGQLFKNKLQMYGAQPIPLSEEVLEQRKIRRRTNSRMFKSFSRCLDAGLRGDFRRFIPEDKVISDFALAKGFQANELLIPFDEGGQKKAIQQFYAEYSFMKSIGRPFPWVLQKQGHEAVLVPK